MRPLTLPDPPLSDGLVSLRPFTLDDVPAVTAAMQDREVSRWTASIPWPYDENHAREWIGLHDEQRRAGEAVNFAITTGDSETVVGAIGIEKFDLVERVAQVGYWVARQQRNHGLATHATVLASQWALTDLELAHLRLFTIVGNQASERVAEKAGYRVLEVVPDHDLGTKRRPSSDGNFGATPPSRITHQPVAYTFTADPVLGEIDVYAGGMRVRCWVFGRPRKSGG